VENNNSTNRKFNKKEFSNQKRKVSNLRLDSEKSRVKESKIEEIENSDDEIIEIPIRYLEVDDEEVLKERDGNRSFNKNEYSKKQIYS